MESTSYVLSFRMVFFYYVTTGWIFDISLWENSINQSMSSLQKLMNYDTTNMNVCMVTHKSRVLLLFLTFSLLLIPTRKNYILYTVANPARGLLNREREENKK